MAAACKIPEGEALLVYIPVDEPELTTGRKGLSVVYAVATMGKKRFTANMFAQFLAAVDHAVSGLCKMTVGNPTSTASTLTRRLQEENLDAMSDAVTHAVLVVASIFSVLLSGYSRSRRHVRDYSQDEIWRVSNYGSNALIFDLAELAMTRLQETHVDQLAQYYSFTSKLPYLGHDDKGEFGYLLVENGALISFPF